MSRAACREAHHYLGIDEARRRLSALETEASAPDLWDDPDRARKVSGELSAVRDDVELVDELDAPGLRRADAVRSRRARRDDESLEPEIASELDDLRRTLDRLELRALFSGEHDERDAICEVHSGAGGTDAQDWAAMLLRMFTRWAEQKGFAVEIDETQEGQEAGITSATFIIKGRYAYGMLAGERGVHRLIRISPFDGNARRQTAFASFDCVPALEADRRARDRPDRPAHRHVPLVGRGRPARERHRLRGAHHAPPDRHRRVVPERAVADPEQGQGDADPRGPPRRARTRGAPQGARSASPATSATSRSATRSAPTRSRRTNS